MLDDLQELSKAAAAYRAAAVAAGLSWPGPAGNTGGTGSAGEPPTDLVHRIFSVDQVPGQLAWLQAQGWDTGRLFPAGGWLLPWPTDVDETLDNLSFAIGTPFPWHQQIPLFHFEIIVYTFVLAGEHAGEIWRYEASPDAWDSVRAATSLAGLLTQWAKGITSGAVTYGELNRWLQIAPDAQDPFRYLLDQGADLDPFAFPVSVPYTHLPLLRERQRVCGVDMDCIERGADCQFELLEAIDAARASLHG